jgi:hypothetical protein
MLFHLKSDVKGVPYCNLTVESDDSEKKLEELFKAISRFPIFFLTGPPDFRFKKKHEYEK